MTIVQFTRFRVPPERESAVLAARRASLHACRDADPPLCGAFLVRLDDGEWLDIAMWAAQPGTDVFDDPRQAAARSGFYGQIDELLGEECGIIVHQDPGQDPSHPPGSGHGAAAAGLLGGP